MTPPDLQRKVSGTIRKKQLILESCRARGLERIGVREIHAIAADLRRQLGEKHPCSRSYIASVLQQAGRRVDYNDRYVDPWMEEPYASRLEGLLEFRDFESTEKSLRNLDVLYREYREMQDRVGTTLVRSLALKGKQRAESIAANRRVNPQKRLEKQEIARWFRVWLEVSDLFFDWLDLRKQSEEFRKLFTGIDGQGQESSPARS